MIEDSWDDVEAWDSGSDLDFVGNDGPEDGTDG